MYALPSCTRIQVVREDDCVELECDSGASVAKAPVGDRPAHHHAAFQRAAGNRAERAVEKSRAEEDDADQRDDPENESNDPTQCRHAGNLPSGSTAW
jgi:hypothetical protein